MSVPKITRLQIVCTGIPRLVVYGGDAISARGMRYIFLAKDDGETCSTLRQETDGRVQISRVITPPPALKSAVRLAVQNAVREASIT
jgi:hypothetical protein